MRPVVISLMLIPLVCWSIPASAGELGYVIHNGVRLSVAGQKSIWSASRRKVTVYLLDCPYQDELLENWTQRDEFLICPRPPRNESETLAAKFEFRISDAGRLEQVELRTRGIGPDAYHRTFRHVWKDSFPVRNLSVSENNELLFNAAVDLPDEGLLAAID